MIVAKVILGMHNGDPTSLEALSLIGVSQAWRVRIEVKDLQLGISQGPSQEVVRGVRGGRNTCRKG